MNIEIPAFSKRGNWYKGNLHTHTVLSDGKATAQQIAALYRKAGYHFLAITDHNVFQTYPQFSDERFLMLAGIELTPGFDRSDRELMETMEAYQKGEFEFKKARPSLCQKIDALCSPHVIAVSRQESSVFWEAESCRLTGIQNMIDYAAGKDCLSVVAHPTWSKLDTQTLLALHGHTAIEVYNHASSPWEESSIHWDSVLDHGVRAFGMACDDTHEPGDACGGYLMVRAASLTYDAIIGALESGDYYSSCGPVIENFYFDGGNVGICCSKVKEIRFLTDNRFGRTYRAEKGSFLTHCTHKLLGNEQYVRAEIVDIEGRKAWTNPVFL